jgi:hypothetical protein
LTPTCCSFFESTVFFLDAFMIISFPLIFNNLMAVGLRVTAFVYSELTESVSLRSFASLKNDSLLLSL